MNNPQDMIGKQFARLVVLSFVGRNKHSSPMYECRCRCGVVKVICGSSLKSGETNSCGCYAKDMASAANIIHGLSRKHNSEYEIWKAMKGRCGNPNNAKYTDYGGRGISVCERWSISFLNFIADMGKRPSKRHSIDRIDNNGNYEPSNCKWRTIEEQSRNKRSNRYFTHGSKTMILQDWANYFEVDQSTLVEHLRTKSFDSIFYFYEDKQKAKSSKIRQGITPSQNFFRKFRQPVSNKKPNSE